MTTLHDAPAAPVQNGTLRSERQLLHDQLLAIETWHGLRHAKEAAARSLAESRERTLLASRRLDQLRRQQRELCDRAEQQLLTGRQALVRPTAVIAHRNPWMRDKLCEGLAGLGVTVSCAVEDGARAWAAVVLDQPDLVLVEDLLPGTSGLELIEQSRVLAPHSVLGAQCESELGLGELLDAGAHAAFTRRVPPQLVAEQLVDCWSGAVSGIRIA